MSSKSINDCFSEDTSEETECLLHASVKEFVCLEEVKNFEIDGEELRKREKHEEREEKETELLGGVEEVFIICEGEETWNGTGKQNSETLEGKETINEQENMLSIRDESKLEDEATFERLITLAEREESDIEADPRTTEQKRDDKLVLCENFEDDGDTCEECFKILEENAEQLVKSCSEKVSALDGLSLEETDIFDETAGLNESQKSCKFPHNVDLDSSGSFRASVRSLTTSLSIPSSRGCPSKRDLHLDLDECRICHDVEGQDMISPCHCAGTSKWVHESCIIRWIRHTKTKQCEICTCPITVKRKKKPIDQWTRPSATCGPCNKLDIWYCFVLALSIFIIVGFVVLQSRYDVTDQIETTVIFASIYVLCGMIIMMKARYFWTWFVHRSSFWGNWKNLNEEWRIVEANEPNIQSPLSPV